MKNKKAIYFLLPVVVLVWGTIFYKIYQSTDKGNQGVIVRSSQVIESEGYQLDTFSLLANYDDPFLKHVRVSSQPSEKKEAVKKEQIKPKNEAKPIKWPNITYGGIVVNKNSKQELVMVMVNGNSHLMKKKETRSNVQLLEVTPDSILVSYGDEKKYIRK